MRTIFNCGQSTTRHICVIRFFSAKGTENLEIYDKKF